jgi:hypothetical protein
MLLCEPDGMVHGAWIAAVVTAGDIRRSHQGHERIIVAGTPRPIAFAHVTVEIDKHVVDG